MKRVGVNVLSPTTIPMWFVLIFMILITTSFASHFMSGAYDWELTDAGASAKLNVIQSYRWSAFFGKTVALTGSQTISPSSLYFGKATTSGTKSTSVSTSLKLSVTAKNVDTLAIGDFWLFGGTSFVLDTHTTFKKQFSFTSPLFAYFSMCCRISGLQDSNSSKTAAHSGWWAPHLSALSVYGRNFPREWVEYGVNINTMWQLGAVNRDSNAALTFAFSPTSGGLPGQSSLGSYAPDQSLSGKALTIPNRYSPVFNWVPSRKPAAGKYMGYATSFQVEDISFSTKAKLGVQLDFLFMSGNPCLPTDTTCNHAPTLSDNLLAHEVLATIPYYYVFVATDIDSAQQLTIEHDSPLPTGMSVTLKHGSQTTVVNNKAQATLELAFDTEIDGARSSLLCMKAVDSGGTTSSGSFCSTYTVVRPPYMFISGTARKFSTSNDSNRMNGVTYPWGTAVLSNTVSGSLRRPTLTTSSTGITSTAFDNWWSDSAASAVTLYSMTMVQHSSLNVGYDKYDNARPQRVYTLKNPQWSKKIGQNEFWSYEVHTKMDILDTETLSFGITGGELFVFINSVLIVSITDKMSAVNVNQIQLSNMAYNISYTDIRKKIGARTGGLTEKADSYNVDIFYTHRNTANPGSFYLSFANSTACSAITLLRSPQYASLLESAQVFNYVTSNWTKAFPTGNAQWYTSLSTATATSAGLQLISTTDTATSSVAWFNTTNVKVLSGFEFTFSFKMTGNANGLVFAIQNHSPQFKGSDGAGLGYSGGTNVVALEFDTFADSGVDTPYNYQHISVHTSSLSNPIVSSIESASTWPSGSQPVGNLGVTSPDLEFRFTNGTEHNIRIELSPSEVSYFMYVYVNENIKPLYTASLDKDFMKTAFADGAFIGFTTSNTASRAGAITITKAKLIVIPPLASTSKVTNAATLSSAAGETLSAIIQLQDACGSPLLVAGEAPKMFGKMIHKYSFVPEVVDDDNAVFDTITTTIEDLGAGRYRFSGVPRRAGSYKFYLYYREQDQSEGQGQPFGKVPLTSQNEKYITDHFYTANVIAGQMDAEKSFYTYSDITPSLTNTKDTAFFYNTTINDGVVCIAVSSTANLIANTKGQVFTNVADYTTWAGKQQLAVCVNRDSTVTIVNTARAAAGVSGTAPTTQYSATWVIEKGQTRDFKYNLQTAEFSTTQVGLLTFYLLSACPNHSAGTYGEGMILLQPTYMAVDTMETGHYYIALRDRFGNWVKTGADEDLIQSYTPSLPYVGTPMQMEGGGEPFLIADFTAGQTSGEYKLAVTTASLIPIGSTGTLIVNAGAAWHETSSASALTVGGPVDSNLGFNVLLRDKGTNAVLSQSDDLMEIYRIDFVDTEDPTRIPFSIDQQTLYSTMWNPLTKQYEVKYTPTFAGVYYIKIYINPTEEAKKNPALLANFEMTQSKGQVVAILAGPAHRYSKVAEYLPDSNDATTKTLTLAGIAQTVTFPLGDAYAAGTSTQYNIQSRDVYGNTRITSVAAGLEYRMELFKLTTNNELPVDSTSATMLTTAEFETYIDTTLSNLFVEKTNYLTAVHAGSGQYITRVVWKKAQTEGIGVRFVLYNTNTNTREIISAYTYAANGYTQQAQQTGESDQQYASRQGLATFIAKVNAGEITSRSFIELMCGNVVCTTTSPITNAGTNPSITFRFIAKDRYDNILTNAELKSEAILREVLSIAYETSTSTYYASNEFMYGGYNAAGKYFTGSITTKIAGEYKFSTTINTDSASAQTTAVSTKFFIVPAVSDIPTISTGLLFPSALSTKTTVNVEFLDRDVYNNQRLSKISTTDVEETEFQIFLQRQGDTTCMDFSMIASGEEEEEGDEQVRACQPTQGSGRPSYQCAIRATDYFENQSAAILLTTAACPKDTTTGCPSTTCSRSQTVRVEESGETSAYLIAVEQVNSGIVKILNAGEFNLGSFTAGTALKFYAAEPIDAGKRNAAAWTDGFLRSLTLVGQGSTHQFNSVSASAQECTAALSPLVCTTGNGMLGKRVYVFSLSYTKTLPSTKLNFAITYIDISTENQDGSFYSFAIKPTIVDPNRSILDRTQSTVTVIAGNGWRYRWAPVDKYGNSIAKLEDFIGLDILKSAIYRSTNSFITKDNIQCTFQEYEDFVLPIDEEQQQEEFDADGNPILPAFVENRASTDPVGVVTCDVPGTSFTTAGITAVYIAVTLDINIDFIIGVPGKTTDYINQQMIMLNIKPARAYLPNTILSLFPSDSLGFQGTSSNYPIAGNDLTIYSFPRDLYLNPTSLTDGVENLKIDLTAGLDAFIGTTSTTGQPTYSVVENWAESTTYTTTQKTIFETKIKIDQPTRDGFDLTLTSTNAGSTATNLIKLTSNQPLEQPLESIDITIDQKTKYKTALYLPTQLEQPLEGKDLYLTVDSIFNYVLKIRDLNDQPYLRNIAQSTSTDVSNIMVSFEYLGLDGQGGDDVKKTLPMSVGAMYDLDISSTRALYGEFIVSTPTASLSTIGKYKLIVTILIDNVPTQIAEYTFNVAAGMPYIDYTTMEISQFATGIPGTIKFKLFDKLNNLITTQWIDTGDDIIVGYKPKLNRVIATIHVGQPQCTDVHEPEIMYNTNGDVTEFSTSYALDYVHESVLPTWDMGIKFDSQTGVYTALITPLSGIYTMNLTLISTTQLNLPTSYASCERLLPFSFKVLTGTAVGAKSDYTITPASDLAKVPGRNDAGYAGLTYHVELNLKDQEGTAVEKTTQAYLFYSGDDQQSEEMFNKQATEYLYFNQSDPTNKESSLNVLQVESRDLTSQYGYGLYQFTFIPTKAGTYQFCIFIFEESTQRWTRVTGGTSIQIFVVYHGTPAQAIVSPIQTPLIAGETLQFTVAALDAYGNDVTTAELHSLSLTITRSATTFLPLNITNDNDGTITITSGALVDIDDLRWNIYDTITSDTGITTARTAISWEGYYTIIVTLRSKDGMKLYATQEVSNIGVIHQTCAGQYLAKYPNATYNDIPQLRCLSDKFECVKSYTECTTVKDTIVCPYGEVYDDNKQLCVLLTDYTIPIEDIQPGQNDGKLVYCQTTGTFVYDLAVECPPPLTCPTGTTQCENSPTECRADVKDCPSIAACPAGMVVCPNGITCATNLSTCPIIPQEVYDECANSNIEEASIMGGTKMIVCPNSGLCVADLSDCPTTPSCPYAEQILCLTDGSCRFNNNECPTPPNEELINASPKSCQTLLNDNNAVLCMDGLTCALSFAQCPQQVTCPVGQLKCATDGSCKQRIEDCSIPEQTFYEYQVYLAQKEGGSDDDQIIKDFVPILKPNVTTTKCAPTEYQCPLSGQCVQNSLLCATPVTCPVDSPVLCSDYSCAKTLALCQKPLSCETSSTYGAITCPGTGQCVTSAEFCTPTKVCSEGQSLCATTRECVTKQSDCPSQSTCAPSIPFMCSNGECRASLADCPSSYACPANKPIICSQTGACAASQEVCYANNQQTVNNNNGNDDAADGTDDGESGLNPDQDDTDEEYEYDPLQGLGLNDCPNNFVRCASGACAKTLLTCPTVTTCPVGLKRCSDGTCRADCNNINSQDCNAQGLVQCPVATQGTVCARRLAECPQSPTCPLTAPVKCIDNSCAINLESCPEFIATTNDSGMNAFKYPEDRVPCADGSWSYDQCPTSVTCLPEMPIKCNDLVTCKSTISQCATLSPCGSEDKPYRCSTGVCVASIVDCVSPTDSICPSDKPIKCPLYNTEFSCVDELKNCPQYLAAIEEKKQKDQQQQQQEDGSSSSGSSSGSSSDSTTKWEDIFNTDLNEKTIITEMDKKVTRTDELNALYEFTGCQTGYTYCRVSGLCVQSASSCPDMICPLSFPYLCPDGSCQESSTHCPNDNGCPYDLPVRCPGEGSCVDRLYNCPPSQCDAAEEKACADGSCVDKFASCPFAANGCPVGKARCSDGTCVTNIEDCIAKTNAQRDFFPNTCPPAMSYKCANGLCVEEAAQCPQTSSYTVQIQEEQQVEKLDPITGEVIDIITTIVTVTKPVCWEDPTKPVLCANGQCMASTELCPMVKPCTGEQSIRCDDGSCRADQKQCPKRLTPCPIGYERCKQENFDDVKILDGMCAPIGQCLAVNGCPVLGDKTAAYFRCDNGKCVLPTEKDTQCKATTEANGCPSSTPTKCWNGECIVGNSAQCPPTNGCTVEQPFRCQSGICLKNMEECELTKENEKTCELFTCANGDCVAEESLCKTTFGCPVDTPIRCGDGTCKKYSAEYRNPAFGLTKQQIILDTCAPVTLCATDAYKMCSNSRCVLDLQECDADLTSIIVGSTSGNTDSGSSSGTDGSSTQSCESQGLVTCYDNKTCRPTLDKCFSKPMDVNITKIITTTTTQTIIDPTTGEESTIEVEEEKEVVEVVTLWVTDDELTQSSIIPTCPVSSAVQCANGACVTDYVMCPTVNLPLFSTINGSPSASQQSIVERPNGDEVTQVLCSDGAYRDTYEQCINVAQQIIEQKNSIVLKKYQEKIEALQAAGWSSKDIEKYYPDPFIASTPPVPVDNDDGDESDVLPPDQDGGDDQQGDGSGDVPTPPPDDGEQEGGGEDDGESTIIIEYNPNYEFALMLPTSYCSDGTPIYNYASPRIVCGIIPACPTGHWRCMDGTCSTSQCVGITWDTFSEEKQQQCSNENGFDLCVDGSCAKIGECPQFNGCPIGFYQCANRECTANGEQQCSAASNRNADKFAKTLLSDAPKYNNNNKDNKKKSLKQQQQPQRVQTIDEVSISLTENINDLPYNSMIKQFHDELKKFDAKLPWQLRQKQKQQQDDVEEEEQEYTAEEVAVLDISAKKFRTTIQTGVAQQQQQRPATVDGVNKYYKSCSTDLSTCMSTQQIAKTSILYDATQSEATYTIGPLATSFTVKLSSGLAVDQTKDTSIYFSPVGESVYYNATNRVTYSRVDEFGEALTAVQTVLSPVMTCTAGSGIIEPFTVPIEISSLIDRNVMIPNIAPQDICLAQLKRYPQFNYAVWECLYTTEQRLSGDLQYSVRQSSTQPLKQAISTITTCKDNILSSKTKTEPAIYAFIHQPVPTHQVYKMSLDTFLKDNIVWIMFVIIGAVFVLFALIYAIMRLSRYAKKTTGVKSEIERTEDELRQMEQGVHQKKDDEIILQANPMSLAIQQQEKMKDETDPELIERKKREQEDAQLEAAERQEFINTLDEANKADLERLEKLRQQAASRTAKRL